MKSPEHSFRDWQREAFGFGYGSDEQHILPALKKMMELIPDRGPYDCSWIETEMGSEVAWLLLSVLCRMEIIEYGTNPKVGTSPRCGWLTSKGAALQDYLTAKTADQLYQAAMAEYDYDCGMDFCNCEGGVRGERCKNNLSRLSP